MEPTQITILPLEKPAIDATTPSPATTKPTTTAIPKPTTTTTQPNHAPATTKPIERSPLKPMTTTSSSSAPPKLLTRVIHAPCTCIHQLHKTKTNSPLLEILLYSIFLASLVLYSVDLGNNSQNYWFSSRVEEILAKEEWGMPIKTYMEIAEREEWWEFIQGKFYESIFDSFDDLPNQSQQRRAKLWDGNFIFHSIRFNQIRVNSYPLGGAECQIPTWLDTDSDMADAILERGCAPPYSDELQMTKDFPPRPNTTTPSFNETHGISKCFEYNSDSSSASSWPFTGVIYSAIYPLQGHSCTLNATSHNVKHAEHFLQDLKTSGWFDSSTRLVTIDFTLYSADVNMFVYVRLLAEQAATGGIVTYFDTGGIKLATGIYPSVFVKKVLYRVLLSLMWFVFFIQECYEMFNEGKKYFYDAWNIVESINLFVFVVYACMLLFGEYNLSQEVIKLSNPNIVGIAAWFKFSHQILAANVLLCVFKVFKYIKVDKRMSLIMVTFYKARMALVSMAIVLCVFLTGFALSFTLGFGDRIFGFRNFKRSFMTLINAIFTEFPHADELYQANSFLGPLLILLYQSFVNFCLVSLMIAIIEDAFQTAQADLQREGGDKDLLINNLKRQLLGITRGVDKGTKSLWNKVKRSSVGSFHGAPKGRAGGSGSETSNVEPTCTTSQGKDGEGAIELKPINDRGNDQAKTKRSSIVLNTSINESKIRHDQAPQTDHDQSSQLSALQLKQHHIESELRFNGVYNRINQLESKLDAILLVLSGGGKDEGQKVVAV